MTSQRLIYAVSGLVCLVVAVLILGPRPEGIAGSVDVSVMPTINASLNALTALLLVAGFTAIRTGRKVVHQRLMMTAFTTATLFLVTYVVYHTFKAGPTRYQGDYRSFYLVILLTHIVLAVAILPLALTTLVRGWIGEFADHKRIARPTLAIWLYVSVTGVLVYWMAHT